MGVQVQILSGIRGFLQGVIIIDQNWTIYMYVALVLKGTTTNIQYKSPNFCEELVYALEYY